MKLKSILTVAVAGLMATGAYAQKMKMKSGSFKALAGQKEINLVYKYDNMTVGQGKRAKKEADYIQEKVDEFNGKEAGRGDKWKDSWVKDRDSRFHGKFEALFNKITKSQGWTAGRGKDDAKYTLVIHTTMTEPGFSIPFVMTQPALINLEIALVETANMDKELGRMELLGSPGNAFAGAAWDTGTRIQESYAKAGKSFGKWLPKKGMK